MTLTDNISMVRALNQRQQKSARGLQERCKESHQQTASPTKTSLQVPHVVSMQPAAAAAVISQQQEPFSHVAHSYVTTGAPRGMYGSTRKFFLPFFLIF